MSGETDHGRDRSQGTEAEYAQVFLYRVPRSNHGAFASVEGELANIFRRCGMLRSEFYVLGDAKVFRGFRDLREVLEATSDEEVWVEIDTYRDKADSVQVITAIGNDPATGPLFARVLQLATSAVPSAQGNADRVHP